MNIQVSKETLDGLKIIATKAGANSVEEYLAQLVEYQEANEAINNCESTGLHISHEDMVNWLESWGTKNELAKPKCHK